LLKKKSLTCLIALKTKNSLKVKISRSRSS